MFKKLKDKITEEVMQPLKFQPSMPQLAQAVTSAISSNNNSNLSEPKLNVEDDEEKHDTSSKNAAEKESSTASDYDSSFTTVDLRSPPPLKTRRSSSTSTLNSELFPIYELSPNRFTLQSDLESASEFDDGSSIHQFTNISKENLYEKYRDILQKYHKYRGRYSDTQKYCRELQREYSKAKNVLTETQDKALRRIAELREQCSLEQKAKAHLEDALRNELEERNHIIDTLNTKIELLRSGKDNKYPKDGDVLTVIEAAKNENVTEPKSVGEVDSLKDKIKDFESLLSKAKEAINRKNNQIDDIQKKIESTTNELKTANERTIDLQNSIDSMKRKEEEALLSIAENKMIVHKELEAKETLIQSLENEITKQNAEMKKSKLDPNLKDEASQSNEESCRFEVSSIMDENHLDAKESELRDHRNEHVECKKTIDRLEFSLSNERTERKSTLNRLKSEEEKILSLESEISALKIELSKTNVSDEKLKMLQDKINENDNQLTKDTEKIEKLEKELQKANRLLDDWSKAKNSWNEKEMNLKADKIVLEEIAKNLKNDLNTVRSELASANTKIDDLETRLKTAEEVETRLKEYESRLSQSQVELEFAKKTERELHDEMAKLLQEIGRFESERDTDRKAKENLDAKVRQWAERSESLSRENDTLKSEIETLKETISNESKSSEYDLSLLSRIKNELEKTVAEVELLRNENDNLRNDLENSINEKTIAALNKTEEEKKLRETADKLRSENEELNKKLEETLRNDERLRQECHTFKIESEKFSELAAKRGDESECLRAEKENLENELSNYRSKWENLSAEYDHTKEIIRNSKITENNIENMLETLREQIVRLSTLINLSSNENETPLNSYDYVKTFLNEIEPIIINYGRLRESQIELIAEKDAYSKDLIEMEKKLDAVTNEKETLSRTLSDFEVSSSKECNKYKNVIFELSSRIFTIKNEYLRFKASVKDDLTLLRECCDACKTEFNERTRITFQEHLQLYSDLANRFSDLENKNELLEEEGIELKKEKSKLTKEVEALSEKLEAVGLANKTKISDEIQILKEKYVEEMKEIVAGYETRMAEKDNEYEHLQNKMFLRADRENIAMQEETKEIIKNLQDQLTDAQDSYNKLLEIRNSEQEEMHRKLTEIKEQCAKELRESDKNWRSCLDKKMTEAEDKYKEEINELTKEWTLDRKHDTADTLSNDNLVLEFLEDSAKHCEDAEMLKKQVEILSNELNNYKKSRWRDIDLQLSDNVKQSEITLDDCTEMEYLRNILYKYMMGHQPVVLAKVLAAVVKFDSNQTKQIVQREEQKQSLLGQLGVNSRN